MLPHTNIICTHPCEHRYVQETVSSVLPDGRYTKTVMLICGICGSLLESYEGEHFNTDKGNKLHAT